MFQFAVCELGWMLMCIHSINSILKNMHLPFHEIHINKKTADVTVLHHYEREYNLIRQKYQYILSKRNQLFPKLKLAVFKGI